MEGEQPLAGKEGKEEKGKRGKARGAPDSLGRLMLSLSWAGGGC